ncbi:DUF3060 domain-containing protein [Corallococcus praedator]|uniref:DUF3060 domain-containing protein n=1 Tax=Corallococcus praedator TaxID=2316724 RepID=A0ABX9QKZ8_9BACT|nr:MULTISPECIES: DUF3060 domain-containing protein [Corallococcus]RKH18264.1 DUF3060 domain-containing protein [Corallococcus sp. CA047B]RKH32849.1 DUF3060 domain-containing protein [Corallococcus sp. CA031C]RKI11931.1 DUF3060 domain-containing protein [Corallococcus praedator]
MNRKLGTAVFMMMACTFGPMTAAAEEDDESASEATIDVTGTGETSTHECKPDSTVEITGASNNVTLTGECKSVTVNGSSNVVKVEATRVIDVTGASNTVTWKRGHGKSKPKVSRTGMGNKITQEK